MSTPIFIMQQSTHLMQQVVVNKVFEMVMMRRTRKTILILMSAGILTLSRKERNIYRSYYQKERRSRHGSNLF